MPCLATMRLKGLFQTEFSRLRLPLPLTCVFLLCLSASVARAQSQVFPKWVARYDAAHAFDSPAAMAADGSGNTYVTGTACLNLAAADPTVCADNEALTIRYDSQGQIVWKAWLSSTGHDATGLQVAVDSAGNVYVLFLTWQVRDQFNSVSSPEGAVAKYSPSGVRQWINFIGSKSSATYMPRQLAVSPQGHVYITFTSGPAQYSNVTDAVTVKCDTNGKYVWWKKASPVPNTLNSPEGIAIDAAENVYVIVHSEFNSQVHESIIFRYDASGNLLNCFGGDKLGNIAAFRVDPQGDS